MPMTIPAIPARVNPGRVASSTGRIALSDTVEDVKTVELLLVEVGASGSGLLSELLRQV